MRALELVTGAALGAAGIGGAVALADRDSGGVELAAGMLLFVPALQGLAISRRTSEGCPAWGLGRLSPEVPRSDVKRQPGP
jgi:hypothetical protein